MDKNDNNINLMLVIVIIVILPVNTISGFVYTSFSGTTKVIRKVKEIKGPKWL